MEMEMEGTADRSVLSQLLLVMQRQQTQHKTSREICRERMETTITPKKTPQTQSQKGPAPGLRTLLHLHGKWET